MNEEICFLGMLASLFFAAAWQLTIVAGILLTPLFGKKIPGKNLACSGVVLPGVFLLHGVFDVLHSDVQ